MSLESLTWQRKFIDGTPGDPKIGGPPRQVPGACWSRVDPTPAQIRSSDCGQGRWLTISEWIGATSTFSVVVESAGEWPLTHSGTVAINSNWAGQLGDGKGDYIGRGECRRPNLRAQLKGSGITPYSRFADGKAVLRSSIREFLCSEAMFHLGVPTTRALSLVTTGEPVVRDIMYDGNPKPEPGAIVCRVAELPSIREFEIHSAMGDYETLRRLVDFTLLNHFEGHDPSSDEGLVTG